MFIEFTIGLSVTVSGLDSVDAICERKESQRTTLNFTLKVRKFLVLTFSISDSSDNNSWRDGECSSSCLGVKIKDSGLILRVHDEMPLILAV